MTLPTLPPCDTPDGNCINAGACNAAGACIRPRVDVQAIAAIAWRCIRECKDYEGPPVMCPAHQEEALAMVGVYTDQFACEVCGKTPRRDGSDIYRQNSPGETPARWRCREHHAPEPVFRPTQQAQDAEEKVYHAYEAARRLRLKHIVEHLDFDVVIAGLCAARRFIFKSYSLPAQNETNWAGRKNEPGE